MTRAQKFDRYILHSVNLVFLELYTIFFVNSLLRFRLPFMGLVFVLSSADLYSSLLLEVWYTFAH